MLIFDYIKSKSQSSHAMIMFHGYGGNKDSLKPLLNVISCNENISYYFIQAPYLLAEKSYSWSYEIEPGVWERDEPKQLLDDFFNQIVFKKYNKF